MAGVWPRQDKTALGHHLCGLFVATGLCAVGEGAGLIRLGWLVGGAKWRGARGRPPQTACLPGLVLVLGVARAAVSSCQRRRGEPRVGFGSPEEASCRR